MIENFFISYSKFRVFLLVTFFISYTALSAHVIDIEFINPYEREQLEKELRNEENKEHFDRMMSNDEDNEEEYDGEKALEYYFENYS